MAFRKQRMGRKKVCYFTKNKIKYIDYKDVELLKRFINANGKLFLDVLLVLVLNIRECLPKQSSVLVKWHYYHM